MSQKLITIAQYRDLPQAGLAKSLLESHGLTCFLDNQFTVGVNWLYSTAVGGVKLKVFETDFAQAKQILQETYISSAGASHIEEDLANESACPKCGKPEIEIKNYTRKFAAISLLLSLPIFFFLKRYRCKGCGHRWK